MNIMQLYYVHDMVFAVNFFFGYTYLELYSDRIIIITRCALLTKIFN